MIDHKMISKVLAVIDPDELIDLTASLVRLNTVWDPVAATSEEPAAQLVANWARTNGFNVRIDNVARNRPNVIITWEAGPGCHRLMFEGHTDVVTPGDISTWKYNPFGAEIVGRRMYGRGTNDTKGNLASMLIAMAALKRSGVPLSGAIIGGVLCDEEGKMKGVLDFIKRGHADQVTGAIICEPQDGLVCTSQKGAIRARYTITGRMCHGAMPLTGLNTAPALACLIQGLHDLEVAAIKGLGRHEHLNWPSITPTVVQAPAYGVPQLNVIPGKAKILVDIRTIPGQNHDTVRDDLIEIAKQVESKMITHYDGLDSLMDLDRNHGIHVTVDFLTNRPCTHTDSHDSVVKAADWATRSITGKEPVHAGVPGATDGTFLWSQKNIPIVTMGAGDRNIPHRVNEWVDLDQLIDTCKIYALTALHYLCPDL